MSRYLTLVAVGDNDSKKTELLLKYTGARGVSQRHDKLIVPRFQNTVHNIVVDSIERTVQFVDTETDLDYSILRREIYERADAVLMCYSVNKKDTFKSIYKRWCMEVRKHAPFVPIILIATEIEARNKNSAVISTQQGEDLKLLIGAYAFIECSTKHFLGVDDVFIEAVGSTRQRRMY